MRCAVLGYGLLKPNIGIVGHSCLLSFSSASSFSWFIFILYTVHYEFVLGSWFLVPFVVTKILRQAPTREDTSQGRSN